jgi:DNA-binding XRE family transcriptional regulator
MPRYKLIEARERAELSQSELAERIGTERKAVNQWKRGDAEPRMEYHRAIRRELNNNDDPELFTNFECRPEGMVSMVKERIHGHVTTPIYGCDTFSRNAEGNNRKRGLEGEQWFSN